MIAVRMVRPCVVLKATPSSNRVSRFEGLRLDDEALPFGKPPITRADDETHQAVVDEHHPDRDDHQHCGHRFLPAIETIHPAVGQQAKEDRAEDAERQGEERGGQRGDGSAPGLQRPGKQDGHHGAEGHGIAEGEIGKTQDAVNQGDSQGADRQLAAIRHAGNDDEIRQQEQRVQDAVHRLNHPRTPGGLARSPSGPRRCRCIGFVPAPGRSPCRRCPGPGGHSAPPPESRCRFWRFR